MSNSSEYNLIYYRWSNRDLLVGGISLLITAVLCVLVVICWQEVREFSRYGYLGAFIISILAGVTVFVPVPSILVVLTLGAVLNPLIVGLAAGAGEAVGSMVIYIIGIGNARAFYSFDKVVTSRFRALIKKRGALSVFTMSAIFNPLFFPFTVMAGIMHFGWWRFLLLCLAGKSVKNVIVAGAGYFGVMAPLEIFGGKLPL